MHTPPEWAAAWQPHVPAPAGRLLEYLADQATPTGRVARLQRLDAVAVCEGPTSLGTLRSVGYWLHQLHRLELVHPQGRAWQLHLERLP